MGLSFKIMKYRTEKNYNSEATYTESELHSNSIAQFLSAYNLFPVFEIA